MMSAATDGKAKIDECSILSTTYRSLVGECNDHQPFQEPLSIPDKIFLSNKSQCVAIDALATVNDESRAVLPTLEYSSMQIKDEVKLRGSKTDMQTEERPSKNLGGVQLNGEVIMNIDRLQENCFEDTSCSVDKAGMNTSNLAEFSSQHANATLLKKGSITNSEFQNGPAIQLKLAKKASMRGEASEALLQWFSGKADAAEGCISKYLSLKMHGFLKVF